MYFKNKLIPVFALLILNGCPHINNALIAQDDLLAYVPKMEIPLELQPEHLRPGAKIVIKAPMQMVCSNGAPIEGFTLCADELDATPSLDRNDWWNCCSPAGWQPSEAYEFNFPSIESMYPCVAGANVEELILTITIENVSFDLASPYACCEQYLEGLFANLYDDCPTGSPCTVVGDGLNNTTPGSGDCAASGDHLNYDTGSSSFPLGIPYTSETTCLNSIITTGGELGVDIIPSFRYQDAAAAGCNCTQDLISQGFITIEYDLQVEFRFCEDDLPNGCYPAEFTQIDPLCETDPTVTLPTTSDNGIDGTWDPSEIDPTGLGGTSVTATFTPDAGQCVGGESIMEVEIIEAIDPFFAQIGPLCENDPPFPLPSTSINGVDGTWDVGTSFDPSGEGGNTVFINFTPDAGVCATTAIMGIIVEPGPVPTFNQIGPLCEIGPPVPLPSTSTNGIGGTWDVGTTFDPSGEGGNAVTINFTPTVGECGSATTMTIDVDAEVVPTFTQIGPLCESDPSVPLPFTSNNGVTGTWDVGSTFDPSGQGGNNVVITFTPAAGECSPEETMTIEVEEELAPEFTQLGPLCETDPPVALPTTSNNGVNGTWDAGTSFDPSGQGGQNVVIEFTPDAGECATTATMTIEVEEEVVPDFNQIGPVCENEGTVSLSGTSNNGIFGNWDVGNFFNPAGQGGTTVTILFTPSANQCASEFEMEIDVLEEEVPEFDPIGPFCQSDDPVTLPNISINGYFGTWNVGTTFDPATQGPGFVTITFSPTPGECASQLDIDVFVEGPITPAFNPIGPFCEDDDPFTLLTTSTNGVEGSWDIGPVFDPNGMTGTTVLEFTPDGGQCAEGSMVSVEVNARPTYTIEEVACNAGFADYFVDILTNGDVVTSTAGAVMNNGGGSFLIDNIPSGVNITVTISNASNGCEVEFDVTAPNCSCPTIPPPTGMNVEVCENAPLSALTAIVGAGLEADWYDAGTGGVLLLENSVTYTPLSAGVYFAEAVDPLTNCTSATRTALELSLIFLDTSFDQTSTCDPLLVGFDTTLYATITCDSVVITEIILASGSETNLTASSCDPLQVGLDTVILMNTDGCDSLVITETSLSAADTMLVPATTCDPLMVGLDTVIYTTSTCDSVVITETMLLASSETNLMASSCDPLQVGLDTMFLMNQNSCDSLVITETVLSAADTMSFPATTCDPMMVGIDTTIYTTSTCDSVVITETVLVAPSETNLMAPTCDPLEAGLDTVILMNIGGCDSLVITETILTVIDTMFFPLTTCDPMMAGIDTTIYPTSTCDSVVITETTYIAPNETNLMAFSCDPILVGIDTAVLMNIGGCDSLVITETSLSAADTMFVPLTTCDPVMVGVDTVIYPTSTCDSVVITETMLLPPSETNLMASTCDPLMVGLDTVILQNQNGCDSLVITETILDQGSETNLMASTCDPLMVGLDTVILQNQSGCDSLVITETILDQNSETNLMASSCDPFMVGLDTVILQNQNSCDSLVITETILDQSSETNLMASTCDPNELGMDTVILFNINGCDSLVITTTSFSDADTSFAQASICDPMLVGMDTVIFNTATCDSVVITTFSLDQGSGEFFMAVTCDAAAVGMDTVFLVNVNGCDSLLITNTMLEVIDPTFLNASSCDPAQVGIDTMVFQTATCDSLVITTTTLAQPSETVSVEMTCLINEAGSDTLVLVNQAGCDSLVITNVILDGSITSALVIGIDPDCNGALGSIEITDVEGGQPPYIYSINGGAFGTEPIITDLLSGFYEIIIEDVTGCQFESSVELADVQVPELFFDPAVINLNLGETVPLLPTTTANVDSLQSIVWTPADSLSISCFDCFETNGTPLTNMEYTITIIDENGCEVSATVLLQVTDEQRVYTPNVFTPNGDGVNDAFTIYADENYVKSIISLMIFDRWGDHVFEGNDFPPNVESFGWTGKRNGNDVEQGVHVFLAELELMSGSTLMVSGEITVIR